MTFAVGELIQERLPQWRAYALSLTRNRAAAEDLVQDTIVRVLTSISHFDGTNFAAWSNTILRNRFIDDCRRARFQCGSVEDLPVTATAQEATQEHTVELHDTLRVLDNLAPQHRDILVLTCVKELSYVRTARQLKIPIGTVRSRLSRARSLLLATLDEKRGQRRNGERPPLPIRSSSTRRKIPAIGLERPPSWQVNGSHRGDRNGQARVHA